MAGTDWDSLDSRVAVTTISDGPCDGSAGLFVTD
jgi:hypothetical protein